MIELFIHNKEKLYFPIVVDGVTWETERRGTPGKLSFSVLKDEGLNIQEGNAVGLKVNGIETFFGFIFKKDRNKDGKIKIIAYDQLRYLKNKFTCRYENTASELIGLLASNFMMKTGYLEDTEYLIEDRIEDNKTLFDMIQRALNDTIQNTGKMFVLYDDYGKLTLRNIESMKLDYLLDNQSAENYNYSSSIEDAYNRVVLTYKESKKSNDPVIVEDKENINNWGILQYKENVQSGRNIKSRAEGLLKLHNKKTRTLKINGALGDIRVRGGSSIPMKLNIGDLIVQNYMVVDRVKHNIKNGHHSMDLTLIGGGYFA